MKVLACLLAACLPVVASARIAPGDIDYMELLKKSELAFVIDGEPLEHPDPEMTCGPRDSDERVIAGADGHISLVPWKASREAEPHFAAAEKHFAARELDAALVEYDLGLAIDPDYGPGWLFSGDIPFHEGDAAGALVRYNKALALDPTMAQAHRFAAHALAKMGRLEEAENELVQALLFEPNYDGALDALEEIGARRGYEVVRRSWPIKANLGQLDGRKVPVHVEMTDGGGPLMYSLCKAAWRYEAAFRAGQLGPSASDDYAWTGTEERECLGAYAVGAMSGASVDLKARSPKDANGKPAAPSEDAVLAEIPDTARHLVDVVKACMLDGFIYYVVAGQRCPRLAVLLPPTMRAEAERYIRRFVMVHHAPAAGPTDIPSPPVAPTERR